MLGHSQGTSFCPVIPTPAYYELTGAALKGKQFYIDLEFIPQSSLNLLKREIGNVRYSTSYRDAACLELSYEAFQSDSIDSYEIRVDSLVHIRYSSEKMAYYATLSFIQLLQDDEGIYSMPTMRLKDAPRFEWRGMHLDVSRHFFSVDELKKFIDLLSFYKFNTFHWHLTDDQGWRIEIEKYPLLTDIGAFRNQTLIGHYDTYPQVYDSIRYGAYYTKAEIREVIRYASERFVDVIPEIEMPGHARAAIAAYPNLSCTQEVLLVPGLWGVFEDIFCSKEMTIVFLQDVLDEVCELFPGKYIHIGGDEAPKSRWKNCEDCQKRMKSEGLTNEQELQSYFIRRMDAYLTAKGKQLIGWDEILEGGLSENAVVMSWRGVQGGLEAARGKHQVVMSPTSHCYFDYYQSEHPAEPLAIGDYLPLEKVYNFEPIPEGLSPTEQSFILGGQANLWTEYMPSMEQVLYMAYPRALAMAQVLWSFSKPDYSTFRAVLTEKQEPILARKGVPFSMAASYPSLSIKQASNGISLQFDGANKQQMLRLETFSHTTGVRTTIADSAQVKLDLLPTSAGEKDSTRLSIHSPSFQDTLTFNFLRHEALGLPVVLETAASKLYNYNGSLMLVDGVIGGHPWKSHQYLGFADSLVRFTIDLGSNKKRKEAILHMLDSPGSWIYLPERITIRGKKKADQQWKIKGVSEILSERTSIKLGAGKIRFIEVTIEPMNRIPDGMNGAGHRPWTFISEFEIESK